MDVVQWHRAIQYLILNLTNNPHVFVIYKPVGFVFGKKYLRKIA